MVPRTINESRQLRRAMKYMEVMMLTIAHVTSNMPQVTSCAMRSESDVTRDMIQPTGVLLK